jgi:hypothetical protein
MSYTITVTNHAPIVIATGATDNSTSLTLIGKNVPNYGQTIAQNLVNLMQNFAGTSQPNGPLAGQLWYDTTSNLLKVFDGVNFSRIATSVVDLNPPANANAGDLWWNTVSQTLNAYSGSSWITVGPLPPVVGSVVTDTITDNINVTHDVARLGLEGSNVAVFSSTTFIPRTSYATLTNIQQGLYIFGNLGVNGTTNLNNLSVSGTANLVAAQAKYADLAEFYSSDFNYEVGTVLMIGGNAEVTQTTSYATTKVVGVVSDKPAYVMNSELEGMRVPVAFTGRVMCKVVGTIEKGDLLVSSVENGVAVSAKNPAPGTIIGKSLNDYNSTDIGMIEIIVGKH